MRPASEGAGGIWAGRPQPHARPGAALGEGRCPDGIPPHRPARARRLGRSAPIRPSPGSSRKNTTPGSPVEPSGSGPSQPL